MFTNPPLDYLGYLMALLPCIGAILVHYFLKKYSGIIWLWFAIYVASISIYTVLARAEEISRLPEWLFGVAIPLQLIIFVSGGLTIAWALGELFFVVVRVDEKVTEEHQS